MQLLAIYAHPDDEAFGAAGTFATLTDHGDTVTLICATRGEVGEISDPSLATPETLGEVREAELRSAMRLVNVSDIRFLGYRDSGMAGTNENADPRAFVQADHRSTTEQVLAILEDVRPDVVLTFGPDGIYGHPDHIKAYEIATSAVEAYSSSASRVPWFYYNTVPRERILEMAKRPNGPFAGMSDDELAAFGTPTELITTVIDIGHQFERKMAAIREHCTQITGDGPWADVVPDELRELMRFERFRLVSKPESAQESDLLTSATAT